jgi:hypothetical protein
MPVHNDKIYLYCRFTLGICNSLHRFKLGAVRQLSIPQLATAYICGTLCARLGEKSTSLS